MRLFAAFTLILSAFVGSIGNANAQSGCSYIAYGAVLTAAQWNQCFGNKQDYTGIPAVTSIIGTSPITATVGGATVTVGLNVGVNFNFTAAQTFGVQQTTQGQLILANTAAGAYSTTIQSSNSATAAWTLTLPVTAGSNNNVLTTNGSGVTAWTALSGIGVATFSAGTTGFTPNSATTGAVTLAGTLGIANGGTNCTSAGITCFNNITGFTAAGTTGTTSTNLVFSTSPTLVTPALGVATGTSLALGGATLGGNALAVTGTSALQATTITSASANALAVGLNGATNPAFNVNASTGSQAAGLNVTGAATGGTVAIAAIDSGSNTNLTINAKGSGTIGIGSVSTGAVTITPATTVTGTLTASNAFGAGSITGPLATNAVKGVMEGDTTTITCSAGVCSAVGAVASSIAVATTTVTNAGTTNCILTVGTVSGGTGLLSSCGPAVVHAASFGLAGNISAAAWTTSGIRYANVSATLTDTTSSGTVATAYTDLFGGDTIAASSGTTFTNYYDAYFKAPTAGTNVTLTNKYALGADSINATALSVGGYAGTFPSAAFTVASLNIVDQTLSGGANVTAYSIGTASSGTKTIDCGNGPLQYLTNGGAFTLAAPSNDGSCVVQVINNGSAGTITLSGFSTNSPFGNAYATTNAAVFDLSITRVDGTSMAVWSGPL